MAATIDRWKGVPASVLRKIVVRVPCEADRRAMARVCRLWGAALARRPDEAPLPLPPQLPWLLLLLPGGPAFSCVHRDDGSSSLPAFSYVHRDDGSSSLPAFPCVHRDDGSSGLTAFTCVHSDDGSSGLTAFSCVHRDDGSSGFHRVRIPGDPRYFFGSYDGRWLFVATREDGHVILNLRDGRRYSIPREFRPEISFSRALQPEASRVIIMLVAILSTAPNEDHCIGAAIVRCPPFDNRSRRQITFWRMGHQLAMAPYDVMFGEPEDVVCYKGEFYFLIAGDSGEHLFVCKPVFNQHGVLEAVSKGLRFIQPHQYRNYEQLPHVRYLVESRGELLMVVKLPPDEPCRFLVFQMTRISTRDTGHMLYNWIMVPELDGRILFLGKGCSKSFEVHDFPGFHSGFYFLDDLHKSNLDISMDNIQFPCNDNGFWFWWRMLPKIERCFRLGQDMSVSSPPVWLLS